MSSSEEDEEYLEESSHSDGEESEEGSDSDGFELQESSDEEEGLVEGGDSDDEEEKQGEMVTRREEKRAVTRSWKASVRDKAAGFTSSSGKTDPNGDVYSNLMDADDLSSDDEAGEKNTIGRVPLHWYDAYDHIGYDITGAKVEKRKGKDRMDQAIANRDDPAARRTIYDMYNDQEVVLSERDMEIIRRMQAGAFAHPEHDDTPDYSAYFSSIEEIMPMSAAPLEKRNFTPSKWETMRVMKIMNAMKEGRYKTSAQVTAEKKEAMNPQSNVFLVWDEAKEDVEKETALTNYHLPAPKMALPGHAESYNPPAEYLLTDEEAKREGELDVEDRERKYDFVPKKHDCLRRVAGYDNFVRERFERCLDLYLCPRKLKRRLNIDPETLLPRLPRPRELKPFPNTLVLQFLGHTRAVRQVSISPDGQYLASAGEDGTVRLWEIDTCLCRNVWDFNSKPKKGKKLREEDRAKIVALAWNPAPSHALLAVALETRVVLIATGTGDQDSTEVTEGLLREVEENAKANGSTGGLEEDNEEEEQEEGEDGDEEEKKSWERNRASKGTACEWYVTSKTEAADAVDEENNRERRGARIGPRLELRLRGSATYLAWHHKGTMAPSQGAKAVMIHQLSKAKTQTPFKKSPGQVQACCFHPNRPFLFVATQTFVKVYNLVEQKLVKKLRSNCKWISSMVVHQSGDHVLCGSYDRRVVWFDLDLSSAPYKTLKFHEKAVRAVTFHPRYPLMASCSDDGSVHVFHSAVYSDLTRNPMIVPLKVLKGHKSAQGKSGMGATSIAFHPHQPWIVSAGADGVINMYQDI